MSEDIRDRIGKVRETVEKSQEEFGAILGVTKSTISLLETKKREPSERLIRDICREFSVNETWLRNGDGPMIRPPKTIDNMIMEEIAKLVKSDDEFVKNFILEYLKLSDEAKQEVKGFIKNISKFAQ